MSSVDYYRECRRRFGEISKYLREKELTGILQVDYTCIAPYDEYCTDFRPSGIHLWTTSTSYYRTVLCPAIAHICCKNAISPRVSQELANEEPGKSHSDAYVYALITVAKNPRIRRVPSMGDVEEVTAFLRATEDVKWGREGDRR